MRRILLAIAMTATSLVLLFGYRTSLPGNSVTPAVAGSVSAPAAAGSTGSVSGTSAAKTYAGSAVDTRWGTVQVQITVAAGKITAASTLQVPDGNQRDVQINNVAVPRLNAEVVKSQSAQIDTVSGATVTSDGYLSSLQSALNAAGL